MVRIVLFLFFFGGIFGTLGDFCHVISQTDGYPPPLIPLPGTGQPLWVPFLFGGATLAIGLGHSWADGWLRSTRPSPRTLKEIVAGLVAFLAIYAVSGFLPMDPNGIRDGVLFLAAVLIWMILDRTWQGLLQAVCTAIGGTAVELTLTHFGAFFYGPNVAGMGGVPSWLPWLYVAAAVAVGNLARYLFARASQQELAPARLPV